MKTSITLIKKMLGGAYNKHYLAGIVGLFAVYSFFIVSTVIAINQCKDLRVEMRTSQARVSELEIKYFALASSIDETKAQSLGFIASETPSFAYMSPLPEKVALVR